MRLIALIIVVGSLILLGRWHSSLSQAQESKKSETDFTADNVLEPDQDPADSRFEFGKHLSSDFDNKSPSDKDPILPVNAKNVRQLSRAVYELPMEEADLLNKLFSLRSDCRIETKIVGDRTEGWVTLEVTADELTQRTVGKFLLTVCPPDKVANTSGRFEGGQRINSKNCLRFTQASISSEDLH